LQSLPGDNEVKRSFHMSKRTPCPQWIAPNGKKRPPDENELDQLIAAREAWAALRRILFQSEKVHLHPVFLGAESPRQASTRADEFVGTGSGFQTEGYAVAPPAGFAAGRAVEGDQLADLQSG